MAEMVHYIDEQGKIHFVNIENTRVPDKYLPQVMEQLQQIDKDRQAVEAQAEAKRQESLLPSASPANTKSPPTDRKSTRLNSSH